MKAKIEEEKQKDIQKRLKERHIYEQMRSDNEALKIQREKDKLVEKEKDKKFITDYNNLIEEQDRKRRANKSMIAISKKYVIFDFNLLKMS